MRLNHVRPWIRTGDFVFFRGRSAVSRVIEMRTHSPYSHVAVAMWIRADGHRQLCLIEADMRAGVRLVPIERYLAECTAAGVLVDWFPIVDPAINRDKVAAYFLKLWGARYSKGFQFLWSFGFFLPWLRRKLHLPAKVEDGRVFCSFAAVEAIVAGGYELPEGYEPAAMDPGAASYLPCLENRGPIDPDQEALAA